MTESTQNWTGPCYADGYAYNSRLDESMVVPTDMAMIDDIWDEREETEKQRNFFRWLFNFRKRK